MPSPKCCRLVESTPVRGRPGSCLCRRHDALVRRKDTEGQPVSETLRRCADQGLGACDVGGAGAGRAVSPGGGVATSPSRTGGRTRREGDRTPASSGLDDACRHRRHRRCGEMRRSGAGQARGPRTPGGLRALGMDRRMRLAVGLLLPRGHARGRAAWHKAMRAGRKAPAEYTECHESRSGRAEAGEHDAARSACCGHAEVARAVGGTRATPPPSSSRWRVRPRRAGRPRARGLVDDKPARRPCGASATTPHDAGCQTEAFLGTVSGGPTEAMRPSRAASGAAGARSRSRRSSVSPPRGRGVVPHRCRARGGGAAVRPMDAPRVS
jgi:hypothetical protein